MFSWLDNLSNGAASFLGSLAGAGLGLIAILAGALYNAHLDRERDDRLRAQEAKATAIAVKEELRMIRDSLVSNAKTIRDMPKNEVSLPNPADYVRVFPQVVPKLGLLNEDAIGPVIEAYTALEEYAGRLLEMVAKSEERDKRRLVVTPAGSAFAAQLSDRVAGKLTTAVDLLAKQASDQ
jgi:hypothetical protein